MKLSKLLPLIFVCALLIPPSLARCEEAMPRGLFVSVLDKDFPLSSRTSMTKLISFAKNANITTLFVQIYRANKAWFPSKVGDSLPYAMCLKTVGEDPFALLIKTAHHEGIEVHAWLNLLSLSENSDAPLLKKYGTSILTRNINEKKSLDDFKIDNQFFLEPSDTLVRQELSKMVKEVLLTYPELDGVQFDYIRYPDVHPAYGYSKANVERFKRVTGSKEIVEGSLIWKDWKRAQVTELLTQLIKTIRTIRPHIQVSTTGCVAYVRAREEAFQDWHRWVDTHLIDSVTMMSYPDNVVDYEKNILDSKRRVKDFSRVNIAVGAYKFINNPTVFKEQFEICKKAEGRSCVVFHYANLVQNPVMGDYLITRDNTNK